MINASPITLPPHTETIPRQLLCKVTTKHKKVLSIFFTFIHVEKQSKYGSFICHVHTTYNNMVINYIPYSSEKTIEKTSCENFFRQAIKIIKYTSWRANLNFFKRHFKCCRKIPHFSITEEEKSNIESIIRNGIKWL